VFELDRDPGEFEGQVPLPHRGAMAGQLTHHLAAQRATGQQRGLCGDRVAHIRRVGGAINKYCPPVGVARARCFFDDQRP
jgi:hypothetical protein